MKMMKLQSYCCGLRCRQCGGSARACEWV